MFRTGEKTKQGREYKVREGYWKENRVPKKSSGEIKDIKEMRVTNPEKDETKKKKKSLNMV